MESVRLVRLRPWIFRLHDRVEVLLKICQVIRNEAERMVKREPLNIRWILGEIAALSIEFGKDGFDFHRPKVLHRALSESFTPPTLCQQHRRVSR